MLIEGLDFTREYVDAKSLSVVENLCSSVRDALSRVCEVELWGGLLSLNTRTQTCARAIMYSSRPSVGISEDIGMIVRPNRYRQQ